MATHSSLNMDRLAKVLGIEKEDREEDAPSINNADIFVEPEPSVWEYIEELTPTLHDIGNYIYNLFPFIHWIGKYNLIWFIGDLIAGVTVGAVVVPQSMAYAALAELAPEFGLYSSFMGVLIYWFFATSKDITIGPVAVMSQVTGNVVLHAAEILPEVPGHVIASALAIIAGSIITFLGLARLGWVVEFIPLPAICAFMTGSALNISFGQLSKLLGISIPNSRAAPYRVIIDTLKRLPDANRYDAALGVSSLAMLYLIRSACSFMAKKQPSRTKLYFFLSTLRTAFVILLYTGISAGMNLHRRDDPLNKILGEVPRGFQHAAAPEINPTIIRAFVSELPAAVIVMLIEHIAISKSFGRVNNYTIDPSQELVAIGVTNLLAPFLGAYPATGSFSRTAIKSKAGVRTPFAGVITALVVLLAIYALTAVFFYIPSAALAAVIIHAVLDVITPPRVVYQFWRVAPLEVVVFFAGVLTIIFDTIETGVYVTICLSFAILIFRLFLSRGRLLGLARIRTIKAAQSGVDIKDPNAPLVQEAETSVRTGFLPLDHEDGSNPRVAIQSPYPGVFIYRFAEGFNYPNASHYLNHLTDTIFRETRRTDPALLGKLGDRPWNQANAPGAKGDEADNRPILKAIILDFSSVNNIDVTAAQTLIDVRNQLDRYAAPETVNWHFANIENRWTKRSLAAAGFGFRTPSQRKGEQGAGNWKTIFSIADLGGSDSAANAAAKAQERTNVQQLKVDDIEQAESPPPSDKDVPVDPSSARLVAVQGLNRPLFHFDLQEAVEAAVANAETKRF